MLKKIFTYIAFLFLCFPVKSQENHYPDNSAKLYIDAYKEIKLMLEDSIPASFKRAVFLTENAYREDLNYRKFLELIEYYQKILESFIKANPIAYKGSDHDNVAKNSAIFQFIADTIWLTKDSVLHYPYTYNFNDYAGQDDWSNIFVSTLIETRKGNCHSMPFLYKILADELGAEAWLSLAPYHMYIKNYCEKSGWYNTELTTAMFPVDAWVSTSGYVEIEAMQSGLYMDTLGTKQALAYCLFDLAKGCEKKRGIREIEFILSCLNLALEYYPNFPNGMIYKAETLKKQFKAYMALYNTKSHKDILQYETPKAIFTEMQEIYVRLLKLGYRQMPLAMYKEWYYSLIQNRNKYQNNKILYILNQNNPKQ